jgi:hypothetical protein
VSGEYWLIGDELFAYCRETLLIFRDGVFQTAYCADRRHVENVLVSRLERLGWRALWRAPRVGRKVVLHYFGLSDEVAGERRWAYGR